MEYTRKHKPIENPGILPQIRKTKKITNTEFTNTTSKQFIIPPKRSPLKPIKFPNTYEIPQEDLEEQYNRGEINDINRRIDQQTRIQEQERAQEREHARKKREGDFNEVEKILNTNVKITTPPHVKTIPPPPPPPVKPKPDEAKLATDVAELENVLNLDEQIQNNKQNIINVLKQIVDERNQIQLCDYTEPHKAKTTSKFANHMPNFYSKIGELIDSTKSSNCYKHLKKIHDFLPKITDFNNSEKDDLVNSKYIIQASCIPKYTTHTVSKDKRKFKEFIENIEMFRMYFEEYTKLHKLGGNNKTKKSRNKNKKNKNKSRLRS